MTRILITQESVEQLPPPAGVTYVFYWQKGAPGFGVRVSRTGNRSYVFRNSVRGKKKTICLGKCSSRSLEDAQLAASDLRNKTSDLKEKTSALKRKIKRNKIEKRSRITKPVPVSKARLARPGRASAPRIGDCFMMYYRHHIVLECSRPKEYLQAFRLYWKPIASMSALKIRQMVLKEWLSSLAVTSGKETANKQLTVLKACIRWSAQQLDLRLKTMADPFEGIKRFKSTPKSSHLKRGVEESSLVGVLERSSDRQARAVELLLLTGQRLSNVMSMKWSDLDLDTSLWTITAQDHKSRKIVPIALSAKAVSLLRVLANGDPFVFPSDRSTSGHIENLHAFWWKIRKEAGIERLRLHDLRHTVGTWLGQSGASAFVIQKALGHANVTTTARYTHLDSHTVIAALDGIQNAPLAGRGA